jgi:hypothetical protein
MKNRDAQKEWISQNLFGLWDKRQIYYQTMRINRDWKGNLGSDLKIEI